MGCKAEFESICSLSCSLVLKGTGVSDDMPRIREDFIEEITFELGLE